MKRFANFSSPAWAPQRDVQQQSHLWNVMRRLGVPDIEELHQFAVHCPEKYYATLIEYLDLRFSKPFTSLVDLQKGPAFPRWFPGGKLNIIDSCLLKHTQKGRHSPAIIVVEEEHS